MAPSLTGKNVLIVEDDFLQAADLTAMLADAGAIAIGPVGSVPEARNLIVRSARIDAAVLDVKVGDTMIYSIVDMLKDRRVAILLATGYDRNTLPAAYADLSWCQKPVPRSTLLTQLNACLDGQVKAGE